LISPPPIIPRFQGSATDYPKRRFYAPQAQVKLNNAVLQEFAKRGLSINEGIAVDARLVKSASKPMSNDDLRREKQRRESAEGEVDKSGKLLKFSRDLESDWTVKDDKPHYGLKEHASVDVDNGFILATILSPASVHDSKYLPYLALASCHTEELIKKIYADKGYFGEPNRSFLNLNGIEDGIMRKDTTGAKLTEFEVDLPASGREEQADIEEEIHCGTILWS